MKRNIANLETMRIEKIFTDRKWQSIPFYHLVFEWEENLAKNLGVDYFYGKKIRKNRIVRKIPLLGLFFLPRERTLKFDIAAQRRPIYNKCSIIPVIVDFYIRDQKGLKKFYKCYSNAPVVFITSKEAYDFLIENKCPLNIRHWPLSISDTYRIEEYSHFEKQYDMVLMGRRNPVLMEFVERYSSSHPKFNYVYREQRNGTFDQEHFGYYSSHGDKVGDIETRDSFLSLMRKAKVVLYATPGIDGGETRTHGFNQVTPRFLEYLACGCHIIARYPKNSDTDFYELEKFCPSIETYEQFETALDKALSTDVDMKTYSEYLSKHYTSVRAKQLLEMLEEF